jgi:hypothetical protein
LTCAIIEQVSADLNSGPILDPLSGRFNANTAAGHHGLFHAVSISASVQR